jgi:hypothetical protein
LLRRVTTIEPHHPDRTYLRLGARTEATKLDVTPDSWQQTDERTDRRRGRTITSFEHTTGWSTREMHPAGDEINLVTVAAPHDVVVPAGVAHSTDGVEPNRIMVVHLARRHATPAALSPAMH